MKNKLLPFFIFSFYILHSAQSIAQTFLNGDFEINSAASGCDYNLPNATFNSEMPDAFAYGAGGEVDIMSNCLPYCNGAQSGNWYIALANSSGAAADEVSLALSSPLVAGGLYQISFWDHGELSGAYVPTPIQIGVSIVNNVTGTIVYTAPAPTIGVWTQRIFSFIAPNNGQFITVSATVTRWTQVDNFQFGIVNPPVINFIASDRHICPNSCIDFTNFTAGGISYQWYFPGGSPDTSTAVDPTFICYNTPGNYPVTLVATNQVGSDSITLNNLIQVYPQPGTPVITQAGNTLYATGGFASYQWYYVSDTISGATDSFYVATQNGNYNLAVVDSNGCTVGVGILNVLVKDMGLTEFNVQNFMFDVYPNPAIEKLNVTCYMLYAGEINLEIYNSIGEKVYQSEIRNLKSEINVADFSRGIYLLKITSEDKVFEKKIIISR